MGDEPELTDSPDSVHRSETMKALSACCLHPNLKVLQLSILHLNNAFMIDEAKQITNLTQEDESIMYVQLSHGKAVNNTSASNKLR